MEWTDLIIALIGGTAAGIINTLAGNGSAITLLILTELLQLPPNLANGSNRLGVFSGSMVGALIFHRNGKLNLERSGPYLIPTIIGAIGGVLLAVWVSNEQFREVFRLMMVLMLVVILVKPKRWLRTTDYERAPRLWV
ncbi:MAG: sulfite exporter TauE/SafE family protein, partial [Bacteroidota bacterium]